MVTYSVLTCSVVLWGGRDTANKYPWRVWAVLTVFQPHWVCPAHSLCAFPGYTAQAPGCSPGNCQAGPGLHALSRSKPLRFRFSGTPQRRRLGWACVLCPSQVQAAPVTRCLGSVVAPVGGCILSPPRPSRSVFWVHNGRAFSDVPCVSSGELISGCDPPSGCHSPESLEVLVSNEACLQYGGGCLSGAAIDRFWLWLSQPACLRRGVGRSTAG